ncbi:putative reductase [compost metagenome]
MWPQVTTENLFQLTDYAGYKRQFLNLFGFERADVDYDADVATDVKFDCIEL